MGNTARSGGAWAVLPPRGRACLALAVALGVANPAPTRAASPSAAELVQTESPAPADTIRVAAPTGRKNADRASILAAIEAVRPGGVVRFASGTYLVGELVRVPTSDIILLGHPDGTTLRGCAPDEFVEQAVAAFACNGLELTGGHQTVRGLTFEYAWHGLFIGCCSPADMAALTSADGPPYRLDQPGGHLIEGNTFRNSSNGLRVAGQSADPIVIRHNEFRNTFHALVVNGGTAHVLDNEVFAPEPERVPTMGHPGGAIIVASFAPVPACGRNVIARNRVDGHTDGIVVTVLVSGISCRGTVIRDNTIVTRELRFARAVQGVRIGSPADSSLTGVPIALSNLAVDSVEAVLDSTVIEGNHIVGGSGLGIEVLRSSGNRIANNTITGITRRDPFPGNTVNSTDPETSGWEAENGAGIWISPGSDGNEIVNNTLTDVAGHAVVLAGDDNVVQGTRLTNAVLDLGAGNRVVPGDRESFEATSRSAALLQSRTDVPRTRTLPGIQTPAFPYGQPEDVGLSSAKLERLGEEVASWVAAGDMVGGELLIVKEGRAVFHEAYGWSDRERRKPVERNSIWSIKSMAKPFTAMAVLMLAEEGRLSLDEPVRRYLPGFAGDPRTTIGHLLSHTSGYREEVGDPSEIHDSFGHWVEDWAAHAPAGTLGEFHYTDFGFGAAGYIVEVVSGMPIGPFTEQRIAAPLGLDDTATDFSSDPAWRARLNAWYRWNDEAGAYHLRWKPEFRGWPFYPAAWGMFSTAMDYARFMAMWMNGGERDGVRLLARRQVEEAFEVHGLDGWGGYGYGWFVEEPHANGMPSAFWHGGGDGTLAIALPAINTMVIFLTHSRAGPHISAMQEVWGMLDVFDYPGLGKVRADEIDLETVALTPPQQARYAGTYVDREDVPGRVANLEARDGILELRITRPGGRAAATWAHLVPLDDGRFAPGRYEQGRVAAYHPAWRVEFTTVGDTATEIRIVSRGDTLFFARRADPDRVRANAAMRRNRVSLAEIVEQTLEMAGVEAARERFRDLLAARPDSVRVIAAEFATLGYRLFENEERLPQATAVFEMAVQAFPAEPGAHEQLGDAYRAAGRLEDAKRSYEQAVELGERQGHEDLRIQRLKLERVTRQIEERRGG